MFVIVCVVLSVLSFSSFSSAASEPFNQELAKGELLVAAAAYCNLDLIAKWTCFWCTFPQNFNVTVVRTIYDPSTDTQGFVGLYRDNQGRNTIGVSMRGTVLFSPINWIHDANFLLTSYNGSQTIKVHRGFLSAYQSVYIKVRNAVSAAQQMCPKCTRLIVTGHSLGAALATLAALDLKANFPQLNIILYNFGSPRVGNTDFASYYQSKIGTSWRITNNRDIVPHYPPQLLTYHHIATEVWERGSQYTICNSSGEDPNCADSIVIPSITDHLIYMGIDLRLGHSHDCGLWPN